MSRLFPESYLVFPWGVVTCVFCGKVDTATAFLNEARVDLLLLAEPCKWWTGSYYDSNDAAPLNLSF